MSLIGRITSCPGCGEHVPLLSWQCPRCAAPPRLPAGSTAVLASGVVILLAAVHTLALPSGSGILSAARPVPQARSTRVMLSAAPVQTPPAPAPLAQTPVQAPPAPSPLAQTPTQAPSAGEPLTQAPTTAPPAGEPLSTAPEPPDFTPPQSGIFNEAPSETETPTIVVSNADDDIMTLVLRDEFGHEYVARCTRGQDAVIQVPPGDYTVDVSSDNPNTGSNSGDAVFRRYKRYSADFETVPAFLADPIHLGD